jgi:hypothetical protein
VFSLERGQLLGGELVPFRIAEQPVGGAGNVAQVEGYRRKAER